MMARAPSTRRRPDWPERLDAVIDAARDQPFAWGRHDCIIFAAACIRAMTDADPLADLPTWDDRRRAAAVIRGAGKGGLVAAITHTIAPHGWPTITPALAGRGDLVIVRGRQGRFAAIGIGSQVAAPGPNGLALAPMAQAFAAWRIG